MSDDNIKSKGQIIKELFEHCIDLSVDERSQYLNQLDIEGDIKSHVMKLLRHDNDQVDLTQAVVDSVQVSLDVKPLKSGMKVGQYQLVKTIGQGGQGEVWLAKRVGGDFSHQVAIKFLKPVHEQHELARFRAERELLASLKHPNIAQLLDGGELEDARPFMVIELVEGLPLLDYAKKHQFNLKQYLTCFLQICEAISYAHSYSVIHRDIKPSNIFITNDGTVKLLDFGIAKFLNKDDVKTQTLPIMTLAYSSPEQVTGAPVSTATDVYALGLLLYEMLTGQRAQAQHTDAPAEMIKEITQEVPVAPSSALKELKNNELNTKDIKGDLDNLILMAIRKEPERRYATVKGMANDVKNYLDGKPLIAVGDSWQYHFTKFISRNPVITLLTTAVLACLIALPMILIHNQQQLTLERDKALSAQKEAQDQNIIANRTTDFLVNILESASPLGHRGEDIKLNDVLASAERQLSVGLDEQPNIKATLLSKLASIYHHLGQTSKSVEHYQNILQIYQSENNLNGQLATLGQLVVMSNFANQQDTAVEYKRQAEAIKNQIIDIKQRAWHEARMATLSNQLNQKSDVPAQLLPVLEELKEQKVNDIELLGRIYNELSISTKDRNQALEYNLKALEYAEKMHGKMHPLYLNRLKNLAHRYKQLEKYDDAENILLELIERSEKLFTKEHPFYGSAIAEIGALYHDKGRFKEVEQYYLEAMKISKELAGEESLSYVLEINNLAFLYEDMGQFEKAEPLYRESIKLREKYHAQSPTRIATSKGNLARLLAKSGKHNKSMRILDEIIPIYKEQNISNKLNSIIQIANLIGSNKSTQQCEQALKDINKVLPQVQKQSMKSWRRMYDELWLGEMSFACGNFELTQTLLTAAFEMSENIYTKNSDGQRLIQSKINSMLEKIN